MQDGQTPDEELLRTYHARRDEAAFAQLVQRHLNLVFGTALRLLGERTAAEEVAQNVFISLARKAASIRPDAGLAGWLHRSAVLEARLRQRTDLRRQTREDLAAQLGTTMPNPDSPDRLPLETLDDALLELPEGDRRTLLLRYFEGRCFRDIGSALGIGEDAAQKRTSRALEALTGILRRRGAVTVTTALAVKTLEAAALTIAPAQLAASITSIALAAAVATSSATTLGILAAKLMALTKTQTTAVCLLLASAPVGYQWHASVQTREALRTAHTQLGDAGTVFAAAQGREVAARRQAEASSTAAANARAELRRANDQIQTAQTLPDASLYLWSESSPYVRIPKAIAGQLRLGAALRVPGPDGRASERRILDAVEADGTTSEALAEGLGITPSEAAAVRDAFSSLNQALQQGAHANAYLTNQTPSEFRTYGKTAFTLVTPSLSDAGDTLRQEFRAQLDGALGLERASVLWQQAEQVFVQKFNSFGASERIQTVVIHEPGNLAFWNASRGPDGTLSEWGNSAGNLSLDLFPERLRPLVADWIARLPAPPVPSVSSSLTPTPKQSP